MLTLFSLDFYEPVSNENNEEDADGDSDAEDLAEAEAEAEADADADADADEDESDLDLAWKMLDVARAIAEKQSGDTMEKVDILSTLAEVALERGVPFWLFIYLFLT